jgi:hypothetical protein
MPPNQPTTGPFRVAASGPVVVGLPVGPTGRAIVGPVVVGGLRVGVTEPVAVADGTTLKRTRLSAAGAVGASTARSTDRTERGEPVTKTSAALRARTAAQTMETRPALTNSVSHVWTPFRSADQAGAVARPGRRRRRRRRTMRASSRSSRMPLASNVSPSRCEDSSTGRATGTLPSVMVAFTVCLTVPLASARLAFQVPSGRSSSRTTRTGAVCARFGVNQIDRGVISESFVCHK